MGISKTSDHIWIKIKMSNHNQEYPASSNAQNQDLKDVDVFLHLLINSKSQNKLSFAMISLGLNIYQIYFIW